MMDCRNGRRRAAICLFILLMVSALSCSSDKKCDVPEEGCPDTPEKALIAFAEAYEGKDLEAYGDLLCEDFLFCFTAAVADTLGLPPENPCWGDSADLISTGNMFGDSEVIGISLDYVYETDWEPAEDVREDTTYTGLRCRIEPDLKVTVEIAGEGHLILWVNESWVDVMVMPDPNEEGCWCVLRMTEIKIPHLNNGLGSATEQSTWGGIKGMWR